MLLERRSFTPEEESDRLWVIDGLVELCHRGVIFAVWLDHWKIKVQWHMWDEREVLPFVKAEQLVVRELIQKGRKPATMETLLTVMITQDWKNLG